MAEKTRKILERRRKRERKKVFFIMGILILLLFISLVVFNNSDKLFNSSDKPYSVYTQTTEAKYSTLEEKFEVLSIAKTNFCANPDFIDSLQEDHRLQGSCCSKMNLHRYIEQVEGLKKYSHIAQIPSDPYDIPVSLARELLGYQKDIQLNPEQQAVYDEAVSLSHEGGPCCCKCWRWYAFEGQAKYLITEHNFNAEQIAEIWDLEDGCGGAGHIESEGH